MLTSAGLSDHALLAHVPGQQVLAYRVVNFVSARVVQVFTLEQDSRTAAVLRQALRVING